MSAAESKLNPDGKVDIDMSLKINQELLVRGGLENFSATEDDPVSMSDPVVLCKASDVKIFMSPIMLRQHPHGGSGFCMYTTTIVDGKVEEVVTKWL